MSSLETICSKRLHKRCFSNTFVNWQFLTTHSGSCGTHQAGHEMKWLLCRQGVYWTIMLKDCIEFARGCQEFQKHEGIQHVPASELHLIIKPCLFQGWALDVIGEIN